MKKNLQGFTLIEMMLGILIFSIVILAGFQALGRVNIRKIKLYTKTDIEKQAFYFSEKMFEMIKGAGTIDYEEYFNRKVVGNTSFASGHFLQETGLGNFGSGGNINTTNYGTGFYYCLSGDLTSMGTGGCADGTFQRYGEYYYQFIDYNSNLDNDLGDEDGDGNFIGDDDDEYLGVGPSVFSGGKNTHELYLISGDSKKRTFFRWKVKQDDNKPNSTNCDFSDQSKPNGLGCFGTIQFLKLDGKDWGMDHNPSILDKNQNDGKIDTWVYDESIYGPGIIAGSNTDHESKWINLFPDYINVSNVEFYVYPNKYNKYSWSDLDPSVNISPYIRINMNLSPSRKKRGGMKGKIPEIKISTSIALNSF